MKLAVCLVVLDSENKVFLTLRSKNLRVFPNSWVLPGGHIDPGESLE
jgi:8-oxo-dGTP pyrophosphatase MutT (NUDIX family)